MMIRIAGLVNDSIVDGPGFRMAVFTQGCPHRCEGCHNPQTWDKDGGKVVEINEIVEQMRKNPLLSGLTLSGGEPFMQLRPCAALAGAAKKMGLNVWCYTGYTWEKLWGWPYARLLLSQIDVLVDGPFVLAEKSLELPWRGSRNQRLIDVQASLREERMVLYAQ